VNFVVHEFFSGLGEHFWGEINTHHAGGIVSEPGTAEALREGGREGGGEGGAR